MWTPEWEQQNNRKEKTKKNIEKNEHTLDVLINFDIGVNM